MKHQSLPLFFTALLLLCMSFAFAQNSKSVNPERDWKLGVEMYTFHAFSFTAALDKLDSANIKFIEGNSFQKAGPEFKDSLIMQLSPTGLARLRQLIEKRGFHMASVYIAPAPRVADWVKQISMAHQLGASFVTAEPPENMWDVIDSIAGVYLTGVAIHNHWRTMSHYWHPDTVLAAIKGHKHFGACVDLGHWPKSGIESIYGLKKLEGHIIAVHLKDANAFNNLQAKDTVAGKGVVDFPAVFIELKRQGFKGNIYIERDADPKPSNLPVVIEEKAYYYQQLKKLK